MTDNYNLKWSDLVFSSKKVVNNLNATFIMAPREISQKRFNELVKSYLPKGNIIVGIANEDYIQGFEGQPQFKTLRFKTIENVVNKVNLSIYKNKIYTLRYSQRDIIYILDKLKFSFVIAINGSWKYVFHSLPIYYVLSSKQLPYVLLSPFTDESEAKLFEKKILLTELTPKGLLSDTEMLNLANKVAEKSFDYLSQTGVTIGLKKGAKYQFILQSFNKVVPFQTYAMHYGSVRETNFAPVHDLNYYDTIHAEVNIIIKALKKNINLGGTTLFINLLPCPNCAIMLAETDINELVYTIDHSDGRAVKILEAADKKVRRIV